jgi:hypothetical protein
MKRTGLTSTPHRRLQTVRGLNRYLHCPPAAFTANNTFRPGSRHHLTFFFYSAAGGRKGRGERLHVWGLRGNLR